MVTRVATIFAVDNAVAVDVDRREDGRYTLRAYAIDDSTVPTSRYNLGGLTVLPVGTTFTAALDAGTRLVRGTGH